MKKPVSVSLNDDQLKTLDLICEAFGFAKRSHAINFLIAYYKATPELVGTFAEGR